MRFERFLNLYRCNARLFNNLRLNETLITTKTFKNATVNLAVSNLGVGLMVQPLYIASLVMEMEQKTENNPAYNINVQFLNFTLNLFGFTSFFGVTFLSLDRFLPVYLLLRY